MHVCFLAFSHQYEFTQLFFQKLTTTFLTCFCRGERRKLAGKKSGLNRGSNSQPPGHESDTLTTEPTGRGSKKLKESCKDKNEVNYYAYFKENSVGLNVFVDKIKTLFWIKYIV